MKLYGLIACAFGLVTILTGGLALFAGPELKTRFGDTVPFVLWFNFLSGFVYVLAGIGLIRLRRWSAPLSMGLFVACALVLIAFGVHVWLGGSFEMRTALAMALRTGVWGVIGFLARRRFAFA